MKIKIDEKSLRTLPFTTAGQRLYFDTKFPGFGVCVGKTKKTYFLQKTKNYKTTRITLGTYPAMNCVQARDKALTFSSEISNNDDFNTQRKAKRALNHFTLQALYDRYKPSLVAQEKHSSLIEYPQIINRHFGDWLDRPLVNITKDSVVQRHQFITRNSGPAIANKSFRILNALFNYAMIDNDQLSNPVKVLAERNLNNIENRRTARIKNNDMESWMSHLLMVPNTSMRLYIIFLLLHGLRKSEASNLRWSDIDLNNRCFTIKNTKNKKPLTLPITAYTQAILSQLELLRVNEWVFPSNSVKSDRIKAPRKALEAINLLSGTNVTPHDLRRTFVSVANSNQTSPYTLKRLINHSTKSDVTSIYISDDIDDLQGPLSSIQSKILEYSKLSLEQLI